MNTQTVEEGVMADGMPIADAIPDEGEAERPSHRAVCVECQLGVTFRSTASGGGFIVVGHTHGDPAITFGMGANGSPLCPNGHGEMTIADDQIPVADAFAQVAGELAEDGPVQRSLPGIVPEFNWQGAYLELEAKAVEVDADHRQWQEDAETAKDSKKRWEKSAETFQKMGLEFRRRRREKSEGPGEQASDTAGPLSNCCRFEQLHPGFPCPIPHDGLTSEHLASEAHGCEAKERQDELDLVQCVEQLAALNWIVSIDVLKALPVDQLSAVEAWALQVTQNPETQEAMLQDLPKGLGRPHVAAEPVTSEDSEITNGCSVCGVTLVTDVALYAGMLVGTDCAGKDVGHHYPKKSRAKSKAKAKPATKGKAKK